jgi:hypothetical protein
MKAESDVKPNKYEISKRANKTIITLIDNIEEVKENEEIKYKYDVYEITLHRDIKQLSDDEYEKYLKIAKAQQLQNDSEVTIFDRIDAIEQAIAEIGEVVYND